MRKWDGQNRSSAVELAALASCDHNLVILSPFSYCSLSPSFLSPSRPLQIESNVVPAGRRITGDGKVGSDFLPFDICPLLHTLVSSSPVVLSLSSALFVSCPILRFCALCSLSRSRSLWSLVVVAAICGRNRTRIAEILPRQRVTGALRSVEPVLLTPPCDAPYFSLRLLEPTNLMIAETR